MLSQWHCLMVRVHLTYNGTLIICDPHGDGHTLLQKLTARLLLVSLKREGEEDGREGGTRGERWDLKNQGK